MTDGYRRAPVYPFDWLIMGYCLLNVVLILLLGRPLNQYFDELIFYASVAGLTALIIKYLDENRNRWHALVRLLYPGLLFTFFYRMTGGMMFLLFDSFYDWQLTTFERMIFGVNPTLYIDQHLLTVWLNELFSACYFSYYLMLPGFLVPVFLKRDYHVLKKALTAMCMMFFVSYVLFFLYPIEGPRWHFAADYIHQIEGPVFRPMVDLVIERGAVRGGCMPSSHVGVALVILLFCFKHYRRVGWALLPINIGLAIGTFWGRFHYVSDVIAGVAIGVFAVALTSKYYDTWNPPAAESDRSKKRAMEHAS